MIRRPGLSFSRSRSENGCVEATCGLCSTTTVQPSATDAALEGVELAHARTRPQGRKGGGARPRATDEAVWTVARHVPRSWNCRAGRPYARVCAVGEERGKWGGGRASPDARPRDSRRTGRRRRTFAETAVRGVPAHEAASEREGRARAARREAAQTRGRT